MFRHTNPFVVQHRHQYNFLHKYFEDSRKELVSKFTGLRELKGTLYMGWHEAVVLWWNEWVQLIRSGSKVYKRRQLYLWGDTNTVKSLSLIHI